LLTVYVDNAQVLSASVTDNFAAGIRVNTILGLIFIHYCYYLYGLNNIEFYLTREDFEVIEDRD